MKSEIYRCDMCKVEKKESNHWLRAIPLRLPLQKGTALSFLVAPWSVNLAAIYPSAAALEMHVCGLPCATKAMCAAMEQTS